MGFRGLEMHPLALDGRPIWITETNLLGSGMNFLLNQAQWILDIVAAAIDKKAEAVFFYGWNNGWRPGSDLKQNPYAQDVLKCMASIYPS
jgi:hypothetical protein